MGAACCGQEQASFDSHLTVYSIAFETEDHVWTVSTLSIQPFCQVQAKYKEALALAASGAAAPPADDFASALFNCAECLQEGAEATVAACAALPDGQLTLAAVQAADAQAAALLDESVATYRRVLDNGQPRVDALVCCANALRWSQGRVGKAWEAVGQQPKSGRLVTSWSSCKQVPAMLE